MAGGRKQDRQIRVSLKGGASFVGCKPVFSRDSKFLLVASGFVIKVLSVKSGECVRELKGHKAKITSICLHPSNTYQVLSCSQDQTIIKWDYTDGAVLKRYKCPNRLHLLTPTYLQHPEFIGIAQVRKQECDVVQFSLPAKDIEVKFKNLEKWMPADASKVSFGCKGEIVACVRQKSLVVRSLKTECRKEHHLKSKQHHAEHADEFTVVACHPQEFCVATGKTNGAINLWYNFMSNKKMVTNTLHWHALPVRSLSFTTEGSYLLSGGHECVLVKWQHNTHFKDTLPRLGAPIIHISSSPDNLHYITSHSDNSIQVINAQFRVTQVFVGLVKARLDEARTQQMPVGLLVDPRTSTLVLNGRPGHLQFYNLNTDKQLYSLDIVCQNYISPENLQRPLVMTELVKAAFSAEGSWLVTVEWRDDKETSPEQRLKFWFYNSKQQTYTLNTAVELPHTDCVASACFRPPITDVPDQSPTVVTTSRDGSFKVWQLTDDSDIYRSRSCWSCKSVGSYHNMAAGAAHFSEDGSLLAVVFDSTLTLWDPDTNALRQAFPFKNPIQYVLFGSYTSSHLVAIATDSKLSVVNLLTCSVCWSVTLSVTAVCRHDVTGHVAVFTTSNQLLVFDLNLPKPVFQMDDVSSVKVNAAIFVPHTRPIAADDRLPWHHSSQLYFLNENQELLTVTAEHEGTEGQVKVTDHVPETPFSFLLSEERRRKLQTVKSQTYHGLHGKPGVEFLKEMLNTPAHVLPPVSGLCASFMERLMITKSSSSVKEYSEEKEDEDDSGGEKDETDSESDMEVDVIKPKTSGYDVTSAFESETEPKKASVLDYSQVDTNMLTWVESL